jgi:hypothetical protein
VHTHRSHDSKFTRAAPERRRTSRKRLRQRSVDGRTQGRSRALGLEVNELLPRAFRRLAEIPGKPGIQVRPRVFSRRNLAHPFHRRPTAAARQSYLGRDLRLSRSCTRPKGRAVRTAEMRLANAVQSTFSKTGTRATRLGSGLTRVSLNRPMGNVHSRHAPASAYELDRTVRRSLPNQVRPMHDLWQLVAGRPARRPPFRREPRRATSLDCCHASRVNGPSFHNPRYLPSPGSPKALKSPRTACALGTLLNAASPAMACATLG